MFRLVLSTVGALGVAGTANAAYCDLPGSNTATEYGIVRTTRTGWKDAWHEDGAAYTTAACGYNIKFEAHPNDSSPFYSCRLPGYYMTPDFCPPGWVIAREINLFNYETFCKLEMIKDVSDGCKDPTRPEVRGNEVGRSGNFCPQWATPVQGACECNAGYEMVNGNQCLPECGTGEVRDAHNVCALIDAQLLNELQCGTVDTQLLDKLKEKQSC